ncbi:MAG TPA: SDR family NAD(P)-dependent oxidoreductase, partial [Bradyrhizobium sp.]|nr:SDR family NAD(P)-dependent oxidoreductase [Bradyrhizobium sp.]
PRRAGVSSFGFGGVNAHVVIEEYVAPERTAAAPAAKGPALVVLSAKTEERLREQATNLLAALSAFEECDLVDIAWTLQVGRDAMEERLAVVVTTLVELEEKLAAFVAGGEGIAGLYRGQVKRNREALSVFAADEDMAQTLDSWVAKGKYGKLLDLWVKGVAVQWEGLYGAAKPRRVALPTYPFAPERYWVPQGAKKATASASSVEVLHPGWRDEALFAVAGEEGESGSIDLCSEDGEVRLRLSGLAPSLAPSELDELEESALATATTEAAIASEDSEAVETLLFEEVWQAAPLQGGAAAGAGVVVCLAARAETQAALSAALGERRVVFVAPEDEAGVDGVRVRRDDAASYAAAFAQIGHEHGGVDAVLYLWAAEGAAAVADAAPIVLSLQAVAASQMKPRRVLLAAPWGEDVDRSHADSWIGFERSVGMVLGGTAVTPLYVAGTATAPDWAALIAVELGAARSRAALYRDGVRHELRVRPVPLVAGETLLKQGGVYLITGGLGGLGLLLARHLASAWDARLVLTGRSTLDDPRVREKLASLGEQRALYVPADVADAAAMIEVVRLCRERFGRLDGVIHAAGLEERGSLLEADVAEFAAVLAPKVAGTLALERALAGEALDFVCHFSSSSAILGDFGSCAYAVANRFQMARTADAGSATRTVAINWPLWAEGGMGLGSASSASLYLKSSGQEALASAEGLALFEQLLKQPGSQRLVLRGRPGRVRRFIRLEQGPATSATLSVAGGGGRRVEMRGLSVAECVVWDLKQQASRILKVRREHLTVDDNLAEFGFDSIGLAEFAAVLGRHWSVAMTPSVFFAHPTLERLCNYLLAEHAAVLEAFYSAEAEAPAMPVASKPLAAKSAKARAVVRHTTATRYSEPIAIIGMSGRFPQSRSVEEMWTILAEGREAVGPAPADREGGWAGTGCRAGFVPGVSEFEPLFFEISPREAEAMDPRQRLLLQEAWAALENAGYGPQHI